MIIVMIVIGKAIVIDMIIIIIVIVNISVSISNVMVLSLSPSLLQSLFLSCTSHVHALGRTLVRIKGWLPICSTRIPREGAPRRPSVRDKNRSAH